MTGVSMSFVVAPDVAEKLQSGSLFDGVAPDQAISLAVGLYASLPAHARRLLRFITEEGEIDAASDLANSVTRALAVVGNSLVERRLADRARETEAGPSDMTEADLALEAVELVRQVRAEHGMASEIKSGADGGS